MKSIELVMFDLGRVLVDFDFQKAIRGLARYTRCSEADMREYFKTTPLWDTFEKGKISPEDFFLRMCADLGIKGLSFDVFTPIWNDIFSEMPASIDILATLRKRYRTAVVSNVNAMHWDYVCQKYEFLKWFDHPIPSYAVGHRKPGTEIYRIALAKAGVDPERSVFVDDVESHITAAKSIGIHAVQFQSAQQLKKDWAGLLND